MLELGSPYRDALGRPPDLGSPIQIDQTDELPWAQAFFDHLRDGEFLDWDPNVGAGIPAGVFPLKGVMSPFSIAYLLTPGWYAVGLKIALTLLFCQTFTYLLIRRLGTGVWPAALGGVAFTFLGSNLVLIHRISAFFVLPAIMWAMHRLAERRTLKRVAVAAVFVAWSWFEGFPSGFAHSFYITLAWCGWLVLRPLFGKELSLRSLAHRVLAIGGSLVLGLGLAAVTLLPFVTEVTERGILSARLFDSTSHLPPMQFFGLFDPKALGLYPEWVGEWWSEGNPVENVTHIGMAVALAASAGLLAATAGRIKLSEAARVVWSFSCGLTVVGLILMFLGGPLLGAAYGLPGIAHNGIARGRYIIGLGIVLIASLTIDHFLRDRLEEQELLRVLAPRLVSLLTLGMLLGLGVAAAPDYLRGVRQAGQGDIVRASLLKNFGITLAAVVLAIAARYSMRRSPRRFLKFFASRPTLTSGVCCAGIALLLFAQLGLPFRDFTPSAPVGDYYTTQKGHHVLRELLADRYRFTGSGRFTFNLNSGQILGLPDLRAVGLHSQEFQNLIKAMNPKAFDADPFRVLVPKDWWDLDSPLLNDLSIRFLALGTHEVPFGIPAEVDVLGPDWVSPKELLPATTFAAPGPIVGVSLPLRSNAACASGHISLSLMSGGRTVAKSSRPSFDLLADWVDYGLSRKKSRLAVWVVFAIKGESLRAGDPYRLDLAVSNPACMVEIGLKDQSPVPLPAKQILIPDPAQPIRLVSTEQAWIYERTQAWPLVSAHNRWRSFDNQEESLAFASTRSPDDLDVVSYVGPERKQPDGAPAAVHSIVKGPGNIKLKTSGKAESLVVVSENVDEGWGATVDGDEVPIAKVDGALLGVFVPPGRHEVELNYLPMSFRIGRGISLAALVLVLVFVLPIGGLLRLGNRKKGKLLSQGPRPVLEPGKLPGEMHGDEQEHHVGNEEKGSRSVGDPDPIRDAVEESGR